MGQTFGRLEVIQKSKKRDRHGHILWQCKCRCGKKKNVVTGDLTLMKVKSCGCLRRERAKATRLKHGESGINKTQLYIAWDNMKNRCSNLNDKNYGGRGIKVCKAWKSFIPFRDWALVHDYREGLQIDRINNNGDYKPSNCRWATKKENLRNTRRTRWETMDGETKSLAEWSEQYEMPYKVVYNRLVDGWDLEDALATPVKQYKPRKPHKRERKSND